MKLLSWLKSFSLLSMLAGSLAIGSVQALADGHGGKAMKSVVDIAVGSKDHTTLVTAVKAAGLVETLSGKGPFTVFAPTNNGFGKLPEGTVANLLKKENLGTLKSILTYHVVAGNFKASDVMKLVKDGNGKASVKTVQGGMLTIMSTESGLMLSDEKGGKVKITATDLKGSNGVIHVIDGVVMPK